MNRISLAFILIFIPLTTLSQSGQLSIPRIDLMPDLPFPLLIRKWEKVTRDYDALIFDLSRTGMNFPLSRVGSAGQYNYPDNTPLFLDSYVGAESHLNQAEAINIIPAIVGASLVGIDKSNQGGRNWVAMTRDFFNLKNGQNVYLNGYSTTSGHDWWYDVMPNVYFYQLRSLYPNIVEEFDTQFITVADRWLECIYALGGNTTPWSVPYMNYRAFNLATSLPLETGVPEPESAGSIAWILYQAYTETRNRKYLEGAYMALDFLTGLNSNPSYELQLTYGTLIAARINAVEGADYPVQKLLDWCFDRGHLRGWGAITGNWGGYDVSGLIGEANDAGNDYAFIMNGFQQAAALAPLPKYDKRYARALAKWILNITNASRLFYHNALPQNHQDSWEWASVYDTSACIPYESMRETLNGLSPFATGDAVRGGWASTNLSLYSGSSVGYLAAVVDTTNIEGVLQIDLNKTDFYGENAFPSYLYFNPTGSSQPVILNLPAGTLDVYDAITETIILTNVSGTATIPVPSGEVRMISLIPAGAETEGRGGKLYVGQSILDYHYGYDFSKQIHVKALAVDLNPAGYGDEINAWCEVGNLNRDDLPVYHWYLDDILLVTTDQGQITFTAPSSSGIRILKCMITLNEQAVEDTIHFSVLPYIPRPPDVQGIEAGNKFVVINSDEEFTVNVNPANNETLAWSWSSDAGNFSSANDRSVIWRAPSDPGIYTITVNVTNQDNLSTLAELPVLVKDTALAQTTPLIYYPFDTDTRNASSDQFHAMASGVTRTADPRGEANLAFRFTGGSNIIYTPNENGLNFTNQVTLSCWVKCERLESERFVISHGSWQQRYKISITPEGRIRWTLKTSLGVVDLDGSFIIDLSRYYHITALYTGYSMELYVNGELDSFTRHSGAILTSTHPLTIGRMNETETLYGLLGSIDEVKIWDREIPPGQIAGLHEKWSAVVRDSASAIISIYPNPADDILHIKLSGTGKLKSVKIYSTNGSLVATYGKSSFAGDQIRLPSELSGLFLIRMVMTDDTILTEKVIIR